jgi:hypothetical protein
MSAGTIWVLSENEIWMDRRAVVGPIDPQVPGKDGRLVPAQALMTLLRDIQDRGQKDLAAKQNPQWTDLQILRNIDARDIGNTIAQSEYSIQLAAEFLENHKFRDWTTHTSSGMPVSADDKKRRALEVARMLCSHEQWKTHGHGISREVAWKELKIKIEHPENVDGLERAIRRLWTLLYWMFENTRIAKVFLSSDYVLFRVKAGQNEHHT